MNKFLEQALTDYYKRIKSKRPNYWACYSSFLQYCDRFQNTSLKELFAEKITILEIKQACKEYVEKSERSSSIVAVQRFLSAIDSFYRYIEKNGIECPSLKNGCRRKEIVCDICISLNEELNQKIFLPFDNPEYIKIVEEEIFRMKKKKFYQLGQSIIYQLLKKYGFKEYVIREFQVEDFNKVEGILLVNTDDECNINIKLPQKIHDDLVEYCRIHTYPDRKNLFTNSRGMPLESGSIFGRALTDRIKERKVIGFNPTSVALLGVSNLILKGLTIGEIIVLTGFDAQKIVDVSQYLLSDVDVEKMINDKLA